MTDDDLMTFGKYKGTKMLNVPAAYLHWFYYNGKVDGENSKNLMVYIEDNIPALKEENKDLIWNKK